MRYISTSIKYILSVYLTGLIFFTAFRFLLLAEHAHTLSGIPGLWSILPRTLLMGLRFDTVVSGYILILPSLLLLVAEISGRLSSGFFSAIHHFICALYSLCLFICAADIPFFNNYNNRLNTSILDWTASPWFMIKMIVQDTSMLGYLLLFIAVVILFLFIMKRKRAKWSKTVTAQPAIQRAYLQRISLAVLFLALMILGIRGRTEEKSPIMIGTAYFSSYDLPNKAGLNPVFTFMIGCTDGWKEENRKIHFVSNEDAAANVKRYLHRVPGNTSISAYIPGHTAEHRYNVVIVLMESMNAFYLQRFGNDKHLTPNLDTLAANGYSFTNFFSAGIHTFNGIFSTLYSFPALMGRHSMEGELIPSYCGLPYCLSQRGYSNIYFTTHDDQFDNVGGFLTANHFDRIVSQKDYPSKLVVSTMGVADHSMFHYSLPLLTEECKQHKPFLAVFMTGSNHPPYVIPTGIPFSTHHTEIRHGGVEYADWAVGDLMKQASAMPWYDSTIFVFLGDHGTWEGESYGTLPYWYSHVPLIIYGPALHDGHHEFHIAGGQTDVFPTIMGLLGGSYLNNTMGTDLLHEGRPYAFFSQDDKIGVVDSNDIYVWEQTGNECMYVTGTNQSLLPAQRAKADSMRSYAFSMIQYAQWLHDNNKAAAQ